MATVVPAQLAFLAIYNPSLGPTDETFRDQIVFYYSRDARSRKKAGSGNAQQDEAARLEDENEKLRQIGLAQGMVDFARYAASLLQLRNKLTSIEEDSQMTVLSIRLIPRSLVLCSMSSRKAGGSWPYVTPPPDYRQV
jgi:hypothetical protein